MRGADTESWKIIEDDYSPLCVALYLRDRLALPITPEIPVPRLMPAVPRDDADDRHHIRPTEWPTWWERLLDADPPATLNPWNWLIDSAPVGGFRDIVEELLDDGFRWLSERKRADRPRSEQTRPCRPEITTMVRSIEESLGRRARPFTLHLTVLPVDGIFEYRARPDRIMISKSARADETRFGAIVEPILRAAM